MGKLTIYISSPTLKMIREDMDYYILLAASKYDIPISLIKSIIDVESTGYPYAVRIEEHLPTVDWAQKAAQTYNIDLTNKKNICSYGPMQVLYLNARHYKYMGDPEGLNNSSNGIRYGCEYLSDLREYFKNKEYGFFDAIAAYNYGHPAFIDFNKNKIFEPKLGERYKNQGYVNDVIKRYRKYLMVQGIKSKYEKQFKIFLEEEN